MKNFLLSTFYFLLSHKKGQSLLEILIAVAVGAILVTAAATVISPALRATTKVSETQTGAALAKELLDNARVLADANWNNFASLLTTSANHYRISGSPFSAVAGDQIITISGTAYTRYFYIDDARRNLASDEIVTSGGVLDPSTKKITVEYSWPGSSLTSISSYITRRRNFVFQQTDWSGGPGQEGPMTSSNFRFSASSANMNYTTTPGSLKIRF